VHPTLVFPNAIGRVFMFVILITNHCNFYYKFHFYNPHPPTRQEQEDQGALSLHAFPYISLCKKKRPLVGQFLGGFYFYAQSSKSHRILPLSAPYWAPIGASPLIFTNLNSDSPKMLPTKFGSNQFSGFEE